ncbi:MAG: hypothetical protein LC808_03785, partial [Actinobacteria bacterium]|nr:hypothetical protein [Actinomycetota bacterium]
DVTLADGRRAVVVASFERWERDTLRTAELVVRTEAKLLALERRVRDAELVDPAKIGRAAQRILGSSPVARLFDVEIAKGRFLYHYDEAAFVYEDLLAGRYVLTTSLGPEQATAAQVVMAYRSLLEAVSRPVGALAPTSSFVGVDRSAKCAAGRDSRKATFCLRAGPTVPRVANDDEWLDAEAAARYINLPTGLDLPACPRGPARGRVPSGASPPPGR